MKLFKKSLLLFLLALIIMLKPTTIVEAKSGNAVTASSKSVYHKIITADEAKKNKYYTKNYYKFGAKGSVTADNNHYANVQLIDGITGSILASSGRKWGKGCVSVNSGYCTTYCCLVTDDNLQLAAIWYGFDK